MMNDLLLPFLWILNGFLTIVYVLGEHIFAVLLLLPVGWLLFKLPAITGSFYQPQFRPWLATSGALSVLAAVLAPTPVPFFLFVMALAGIVALYLEHYNPAGTYWSIITGLALYAMIGLGFAVLRGYLDQAATPTDAGLGSVLAQGQGYLGLLIAFAMYGYPVGYLALLAKGLFVHPPSGNPQDIINYGRTRYHG